jgi:hypothetical protein
MFIPDPKTATKERGEKFFCHSFLFSHKFNKIEHYFSFEELKKKFGSIFKELYNFLPNKSGIWDPGKTYSISRIQGSKRHRIPDPQHWG